jgi:hypothetical protein
MELSLLRQMANVSRKLKEMVDHGKQQAARPDADQICRLSDAAIQRYENAANAIDEVLKGLSVSPFDA